MPILVDSNVILDLVNQDPDWLDWSLSSLERYSTQGLIINPIIYAELSTNAAEIEEVDTLLKSLEIEMVEIPRKALFLASKVHLDYRRRGGTRTTGLPDFFIGAHAQISSIPLVTRDKNRYQTYFPQINLISPSS